MNTPGRSFLFAALLAVFSALFVFNAGAQETFDFTIEENEKPPLANPNPDPLSRTFRGLSLAMDIDELKAALQQDKLFNFRGDRDVSFLPVREETLIETTGPSFIRRAFFQLSGGRTFSMAFTLNTQLIDHYSVFTSFLKKYGLPTALSPSETVWENDETRVSIERPLTVKYIDKTVFNTLTEESKTIESDRIFRTQEFLNEF